MKNLKIDNFENEFAICSDGEKALFAIRRDELPTAAKKGDVILIDDDGKITINGKS